MQTSLGKTIDRRISGQNIWLGHSGSPVDVTPRARFAYNLVEAEAAVGQAMYDELVSYAREKDGDIVIVLLGGRGAQAMYRIVAEKAATNEIDDLLGRLHVFTQDALAPMRMENGLSFVRDFERLLGDNFFSKIKSFTPMRTDTADLEGELAGYMERIAELGGIDLLLLGFGPEDKAASHLCYIKPGSGANFDDYVGLIPISSSILEHHVSKFKAGGSDISEADEKECRAAGYILTLGPAAILSSKRIIQSVVDASTAPGKKSSFKRFLDEELATDREELQKQVDENPGLLLRLHADVRSYILPDLLTD